eukprot:s3036_g7.t1
MLEHIVTNGVEMFVSGMGRECCYGTQMIHTVPEGAIRYLISGHHGKGPGIGPKPKDSVHGGFASFRFEDDAVEVSFHDQKGDQLYSAKVGRSGSLGTGGRPLGRLCRASEPWVAGTNLEVPKPDFSLQKQAPSLNAAAAAFVPSVGAVPATYAEPYAEPYVEPYAEQGEAFAVEPYAEVQAPFSGYAPMDGPGTATPSEVPFAGHGIDAMHAEAMYPGMDGGGEAYDGFGNLMGQDPYAYQDYSQMQAWSWNEAQPFAGDGLPAGGGFPQFRTPGAFPELGMTDDGSDESGREPGRPMASPLDDQLPDPGAGRASEARRSAKDLRKARGQIRGATANAILISGQQTMDEDAVRRLCEPFGAVVRVSVITDREGGTHSATVEFAEFQETEGALKGLQSHPNIWVRRRETQLVGVGDSADSGVKDIDRVMCLDAVEFERLLRRIDFGEDVDSQDGGPVEPTRPIDTAPPRLHPVLKISSPASARGDYETIQNVPMSSSLAASV